MTIELQGFQTNFDDSSLLVLEKEIETLVGAGTKDEQAKKLAEMTNLNVEWKGDTFCCSGKESDCERLLSVLSFD
jgi:hypothetical protein